MTQWSTYSPPPFSCLSYMSLLPLPLSPTTVCPSKESSPSRPSRFRMGSSTTNTEGSSRCGGRERGRDGQEELYACLCLHGRARRWHGDAGSPFTHRDASSSPSSIPLSLLPSLAPALPTPPAPFRSWWRLSIPACPCTSSALAAARPLPPSSVPRSTAAPSSGTSCSVFGSSPLLIHTEPELCS